MGVRRLLVVFVTLAAIIAVAGGAAVGTYRLALARSAPPEPADVIPSAGPVTPGPVLDPILQQAPQPSETGVAKTVGAALEDDRLGSATAGSVIDLASGATLLAEEADAPLIPASTTKLITAAAVLNAVGPAARISTTVVSGNKPGQVVLVGAGDPTLSVAGEGTYPEAASIAQLAVAVRAALGDTTPTGVLVDTSLYEGSPLGPGWDGDLVSSGNVAPIMPIAVDGGRVDPDHNDRVSAPDLVAGRALAKALDLDGTAVARGSAPAGARKLATVSSPTIGRLVEIMVTNSDNVLAEALARQVALARKQPASFSGAAAAVIAELATLGVAVDVADGSGLSRRSRLTASALTTVLTTAAGDEHQQLRPLLTGLSVAGWSGTLDDRFGATASDGAVGVVRGKTGTLSGVNALAGVVVDAEGRQLAFAFIANGVPAGGGEAAEAALDEAAAAVAACGCR